MTYEDLVKANKLIKTTPIQGKEYAQVPERIKAFRSIHPDGKIITDLLAHEDGVAVFRATVETASGEILGTGHAYEKEGSSFINRTSFLENCETSAVGRALGMAGFGIDVAVASAEEVQNAINNQLPDVECSECTKIIQNGKKRDGTSWPAADIVSYSRRRYGRALCPSCMKAVEAAKEKDNA